MPQPQTSQWQQSGGFLHKIFFVALRRRHTGSDILAESKYIFEQPRKQQRNQT
jgi:hypothetical protein